MKSLKAVSALLSVVMCLSMVIAPVTVMADETEVPSETETTETEEEKESEKQAPKEEEKQEPEKEEDPAEEEEKEAQLPGDEESQEAKDAVASGKCGKKLKWTLDKKGTLKITGKGSMYSYMPSDPEQPTNRPWEKYTKQILYVVISKGVTTVGKCAFYNCYNLRSASLPKTIKIIDDWAFRNCLDLCRVNIPSGVTKIGQNAFSACDEILKLSIPASVKTIGDYAFYSCRNLLTVDLPVSGLTEIGTGAFMCCSNLSRFDVPLTVTSIGDNAFANCALLCQIWLSEGQEANLPSTARSNSPNSYCFAHNYLMVGEQRNEGDITYIVTNPATGGTSGTVAAYGFSSKAEKIVVPNTVTLSKDNGYTKVTYKVTKITNIASQFNKEIALKTLVIGSNVSVIADGAFADCQNLESVTGGAGLKTIGAKAFANCPGLKVFTINSKVLSKIGANAFSADVLLTTLNIKKTTKLTKAGVKNSLAGSSVKTVKVKKKKVKKYKKFFKKKNSGRSVKVKK